MINYLKRWLLGPKNIRRELDAVVFVHWGEAEYLNIALEQARKYNETAKTILVTDAPANKFPCVDHVPLSDFCSAYEELKPFYINLSSNDAEYEYKCFARWFIIRDLCERFGFRRIFHFDSDVLIFERLESVLARLPECAFTMSHGHSGHLSYWNIEALSDFCRYILASYRENSLDLMHWYEEYKLKGYPGGYSDMNALESFSRQAGIEFYEMTRIEGNSTFDHNVNLSQNGAEAFKMRSGVKDFRWIDGSPFGVVEDSGRLVRFASVHFQGEAKSKIPSMYRENILRLREKDFNPGAIR